MANSHDRFRSPVPPNGGDLLGEWLLPLIFLFFLPPLGVLLIGLKLLRGGEKRTRSAPAGARTSTVRQEEPAQAAQTVPRKAARRKGAGDPLTRRQRRSRTLTILGAVLAIFSGMVTLSSLAGGLAYYYGFWNLISDLMPTLSLSAGGFGLWLAGLLQGRKLRRYRRYLSMIGKRRTISISQLSAATGLDAARVRDELQDMLDEGCFPAGFLDYGGDRLVMTADGLQDPKPEPPPPSPQEAENAVLSEIRAVNNAIAHEKLSAQIDRIGVITARIFDYQKSHPERSPQLHSFLSYYLPTTLKILRAYAQLEAQGVEGENISAAKGRIEGMMDKVVEGFEKQLDQLFQVDAMDVTTDVQVLEQMLAKDGLSGGGTLQI